MAAHVQDKQLCRLHSCVADNLPVDIFLQLDNFTISSETHISQ